MSWRFKCLVAVVALQLVAGCGAANRQDVQTVKNSGIELSALPPFDSVDVEGLFDVRILSGDHSCLEICDGGLERFYRFSVRRNCLAIRFDERAFYASLPKTGASFIDPLEGSRRGVFGRGVMVTLPALKRIRSGSQACVFATALAQHRLDVDADGGEAWLRGHVDLVEAAVRRKGLVEADGLDCQTVLMDLSGPGKIVAKPSEAARVIRSGSGRWSSDW